MRIGRLRQHSRPAPPPRDAPAHDEADLLLLLAEKFVIQIPGKTYEYLRAGRPILALTPEGALANLLRRIGGGLVVSPSDTAGVLAPSGKASGDGRKGGLITRLIRGR